MRTLRAIPGWPGTAPEETLTRYIHTESNMKAKIEVELQPFTIPNFVLTVKEPRPKQDCIQEIPKYALSELDTYTLDRLCDEFRDAVFAKAGKQQPPQNMPAPPQLRESKY